MTAIPLAKNRAADAPEPRKPRKRRGTSAPYWFIAPFLILFIAMLLVPIGYALYLSLFRSQIIGGQAFVGLANYIQAIGDSQLWTGVGRVLLYLVIQVPIMIGLALFFALAIDSGRIRGSRFVRLAVFAPYAIPGVISTLMWGYFYGQDFGLIAQIFRAVGLTPPNLLDAQNVLGAMMNISTWQYVGYNMIIIYAALRAVPVELYESAALDGAGQWRLAWSVKIPQVRSSILLCVIFSVIGSFQLFTEPSLLNPLSPVVINSSYLPTYYAYNLAFINQQSNYAAAVAFILGFSIMIVSYVVQTITQRRALRG